MRLAQQSLARLSRGIGIVCFIGVRDDLWTMVGCNFKPGLGYIFHGESLQDRFFDQGGLTESNLTETILVLGPGFSRAKLQFKFGSGGKRRYQI